MKKILIALLLFSSSFSFAQEKKIKAVVIAPVIDLLGQPYTRSPKKGLTLQEYYHQIPFSGSGNACLRVHQLLFNEIVTVLEERGQEVKVRISNFYYLRNNDSSLNDTYWTLKKNLLYLDSTIDRSKFPPPISYHEKKIGSHKVNNVVTLKKPFYDRVTKKTYSVGTRFLALPNQNFKGSFDKGAFEVYIIHPETKKLLSTKIPKTNCIRNYFKKPEDQIQNFVQVLRSWTYQSDGFIPYVLGGWSWTQNCLSDHYEAKQDPESQKSYFHRKEWREPSKIGFDCVGIIGRAAQICEIPFFYKNTLTLMKKLDALKKGQQIEEGDLIWFPGHVMVVSSLENNLIVEARGYDNGFGKVREVPVGDVFGEINSFSELTDHYLNKKPVSLLDINGKPFRVYNNFKILKIQSVWQAY